MPRTITAQNLQALIDALIAANIRVVGPKRVDSLCLYAPLAKGEELDLSELPRRSAKETFLPPAEEILSFERQGASTSVRSPDLSRLPATVLIGARPCDAAAPGILDAVFSWDYQDDFFLERRRKTTIVGIACTKADDACFCTAVGLSPDSRQGSDLFLTPLEGDSYAAEALTDKGAALLERHPELFVQGETGRPLPLAEPRAAKVDLAKIKTWLDGHFESPFWGEIASHCVGCGTCAFLCPTCHCFDIVDEGSEAAGCRRKFWDACGFSKFTLHASSHNPRNTQADRFRNRVMHKFKYYHDKFGRTLCTGCGRCIRACPVGIDLVAVLEDINTQG
ncbi:4Fe-4S dicluster domain-containing protein [Trichloromonas sp.]|uniref:4Fe-4S dicluster domain-containing protein n=1 Tax=Trichloromonas sp. TaxID=3069249 RepID=UPI003D8137C8